MECALLVLLEVGGLDVELISLLRSVDFEDANLGEYEVSFDWDDSILVDKSQELNEDLALVSSSLMSKVEFRMRHFGETKAQAQAALQEIMQENATSMQSLIPGLNLDNINNPPTGPEGGEEPDNGVKGVSPPGGSQPKQTTKPTKPTA